MSNLRTGLILVGIAIAAVSFPAVSTAQTFAPINCAACPTMTEVEFTYQVGGGSNVWELPTDPANSNNYINNLSHTRWMFGNSHVRTVALRFDAFHTEYQYDFFSYARNGGSQQDLTGDWSGLGTFWATATSASSLQASPMWMAVWTDDIITKPGFSIGRARVCCSTQDNNIAPIGENDRFYGILLGLNDTVYMKYYPQTDYQDVTIALWPNGVINDIDLFVRCDALPTPSQYDYAGVSEDAQEFIHIPANACPQGHVLYLAANAFDLGSPKTFSLAVHNHHPAYHFAGAIAKTGFNATPTEIAQWQTIIRNGSRRFFGATEGSVYMTTVQVRNNTGSGEIIQIHPGSDRAYWDSPPCGGSSKIHIWNAQLGNPTFAAQTIAHEMGHAWGCFDDEYHDVSGAAQSHCGHSIMGNYLQSPMNNNLCYCNSWSNNVCAQYTGDHEKDFSVTPNPHTAPSWLVIPTRPYINYPTSTPDNYDYVNFDFNGLVANVIP